MSSLLPTDSMTTTGQTFDVRSANNKPYISERGVKLHKRHCQMHPEVQNFDGIYVTKRVREDKLETRLIRLWWNVSCEGPSWGAGTENVFRLKYLGVIFSANDDQTCDIKRDYNDTNGLTSSHVQLENMFWTENAGIRRRSARCLPRFGSVGDD